MFPWRKIKIFQLSPDIPAHIRDTLLRGLFWLAGTLVLTTNHPLESSGPLYWRLWYMGFWKGSKGNQPWALWHRLQTWISVMWMCVWACFLRVAIAVNRFLQINTAWKKKKVTDKGLYAKGSWLSPTRTQSSLFSSRLNMLHAALDLHSACVDRRKDSIWPSWKGLGH